MKKIQIKNEEVLNAFNIINAANYKQLDDSDKIKLYKIARAMKPSARQFEDDSRDAAEKLKPEGIDAKLEKAREYELKTKKGETDKLPMTAEEYQAFIQEEWLPFNSLVQKAVREFADKVVDLEFEPLSEEVFGKLMASNDWTIEKAMTIGALIVE